MDTPQPWQNCDAHTFSLFQQTSPFKSFWMGGYECCDLLNRDGIRTDLLTATGHLEKIDEDYINMLRFGIRTVREGIVWSKVEKKPYQYDWSAVDDLMEAGRRHGIQQVWDICHFGMPDDLSPLHPQFINRFVAICQAFAQRYHDFHTDQSLIITPINEVSFISWLGGEVGLTTPYATGIGWDVKYRLTKAYIKAINAIKTIDRNIQILSTEPLVNIVPEANADDEMYRRAGRANRDQFQVTDMLTGALCPELGGSPYHIDIIGYNYYFSNQFSAEPGDRISWVNEHNDKRFVPLHQLLKRGYQRYNKPIVLAETSHPFEHRAEWLAHIIKEVEKVISCKIPLWGVCWYPLLDRPDWDFLDQWHRSGLWDVNDYNGDRAVYVPLASTFFLSIILQEKFSRLRLKPPHP